MEKKMVWGANLSAMTKAINHSKAVIEAHKKNALFVLLPISFAPNARMNMYLAATCP
jgi:hypothetical protein